MSIKKTGVDQQLIRDLAGILNDTNLTEIEVEFGDLKLRVSRQAQAVHAVAAPAPLASTNGITPKMKAKEVIKIGRKRSLTACRVASISGTP